MKSAKFVVATLVTLAVVAAMVGCQPVTPSAPAEQEQQQPATQAAEPTQAPTKKVYTYRDMVVGFIQTGSEGGWRAANTASFRETAAELGIQLKFYDAQNKMENQIAAFRQFIQDPEVNVIILAALETTGWEEVLQEAKDAGKVVVLEDRRIDAPDTLYATYIGSDFVEEGRKAAEAMCELLKDSPKKNVVELVGNVGSSAAKDRGQGFREKMVECGIEIIKSQTGNWNATEGKAVMEAWLKETTDIQGLFAQNDEMGLGAVEAIKEAGLVPGQDIKIVTVDATAGAFRALIAGEINVTVECNPLLAPQVYEAALKALNGEEMPKWIPSQEGIFYASQGAEELQAILATRKY
jgi:simple sugar transport system substrate-binding protein